MTPSPDSHHTMSRVRSTLSHARHTPGVRYDGPARAATIRLAVAAVLVVALGCTAGHAAPVTTPAPNPGAAAVAGKPATPTADTTPPAGMLSVPNANPFPSTYAPFASRTTLIRGATILTAAGPVLHDASILLRDGKIIAVGASVDAPPDAVVIDGHGRYVTPGIIDVHSHMGVYAAPGVDANLDGNEATDPTTPYVWAEHSVWPQDPYSARAGWRRDHGTDPTRVREPDRRPQRSAQGRSVAHRPGHEVPRRQIRTQDGVWREPQTHLRETRPIHTNGQRGRLPQGMDPGR